MGEDETRSSVGYVQMSRGHPRPRPRPPRRSEPATELGVHAHQTLPLAVATSVVAFEEGVTRWTPPWPDWAPGPATPDGAVRRRGHAAGLWRGADMFALEGAADLLVQPLMDRTGRGGPRQAHRGLRGSIPASSVTPSGLGDVPRGSSDPGEELEQVAGPGPEALLLHHVPSLVGRPTHPAPAQTSSSASRDGRVRESKRIRANAGGAPSGHRAVGSHRFDVRQGQRADPLSLPPGYAEHAQQVLR